MQRIKKALPHLNKLQAAIGKQSVKKAEQVVEEIETILKAQYARTTKFWGDSGINVFPEPAPVFNVRVVRKGAAAVIRINSSMQSAGALNPLWYWLDWGTASRTQANTSPPIPERAALRTKIKDLDSNPFPGFTGNFFVIHAGSQVKGIPAREWSETIGEVVKDAWKDTDGFEIIRKWVQRA